MSSPTTSYIRPLAALVAMVALLIAYDASPARAEGVCSTTAATTTCTFDTPGTSAWTVPAGVTQATFDVFGAQGGSQGPSAGGTGGEATATIAVTPGETLQVNVGGKGGDGAGSTGGAGGFNGGASGGDGCCDGSGGGGGASDVRSDTNASGDFALASRIIVAGGGGGRGGFSTRGGSAGGVGGGLSGGDGTGGSYGFPSLDGAPGGGGTQVAGGAGGGPAELSGVPGSTGALGTGGVGGAGLGNGDGGGGGGGGYYGGGGGGGGMSAGGGGGGSGFGPDGVVFNSGVRSGNGLVTITYTTPDTTPPTLSVSHTADGSNGWNITSPVTLNVSASDSGSGLAGAPTCTDGTTSLTLTAGSTAGNWKAGVSGDGTHDISCSVSDEATNQTTAKDTVNIDTRAPTIGDLGPTTSPSANGWYNTDVTNRFRATDSLSGVNVSGLNAACVAAFPADQAGENVQSKTTSGEGSSVKVTSDGCTDVAGNTAKGIDSATFQIDTTAPTIVVARARKADGSAYTAGAWSNQSVTVSYTCSDGTGSGVASCPAEQTFSGDGADQSASGTATDNAGNTASVTFGDIDIDRTKPRVTCDVASPGPTFVLGGAGGNVKATVADETSGPVATSLSGAANVSLVGNKSVSLTGTDNAGNSTTVGCPYTVKYRFVGPFSPIPQSTYNAGSTIPVKFALADASGTRISDAAARALVASPCKVKVSLGAGTKNCATYNATTDTFQYDLKVPKNLSPGNYAIVVEVSAPDGSGVVNKESVEVNIRR